MLSFLRSDRLRARLAEVFGFDTRSLAVARVALGLLVLLDVYGRLADYSTFYTEGGVLSRIKILELYHRKEYLSLFMASGADWWAGFCFAIEAIAGFCFMIGYRTRLMGAIAWFMMIGCHARFSQVLQAGDLLLRLLLFWSFFMPMGARFSIDSMKGRVAHATNSTVVGVATVAMYFQVLCVYVYTGLLKDGEEWLNGTAVYYALRLDYFAKEPQTSMILEHQWLLEFLNYATLYLELYGPWLMFVPFFFGIVRTVSVFAFIGLHLGFFVFMTLGLFPWISISSWLFLLPGWFWDKVGWRLSATEQSSRSILTIDWARKWPSRAGFLTRLSLINGPILLFFWICIQWNQTTIDGKNWKVTGIQRSIAYTFRLDQKWSMFAPYPIKDGGWYMMPGKLISGEEVDIWNGGEPDWATEEEKKKWTKVLPKPGKEDDVRYRLTREHPEDISGSYINQRWRKYMRRIWSKKHKALRLPLGQYFCRTWNAEHTGKDKLKTFKIVFMKDQTPKPGKSTEVVPVVIWSHNCFKTPEKKTSTAKKSSDKNSSNKRKPAGVRMPNSNEKSSPNKGPTALPAAKKEE